MGARDSTVRFALRRTLAFAAIVLLLFALVEGASSAVIFSYDVLFSRTRVAERRHTQYDSLLGWVNIPSFYIADMYGRGRYLRTNSRGFRSDRETEVAVPEGKYRIICSGDSFTLGYGVANDRTWCHILTELDERFETVNMGQGGYGVDQAYLWYMRDGKVLEHTIHLFAFITADFERMASASFIGYGKPVLRLEGGELITENVPVPRAEYRFPWVIRIGKAAQGLRSVKLAQRTLNKLFPSETAGVVPARQTTREVVEQIFQSLQRTNIAKNSVLVLVYLPAKGDAQDTSRNPWREAVQATAASAGIHFIDLVAALKKEPPEVADALFIPPAGHYNRRGNLWVAETMYQSLMEIPELRARLQ